MSLPRNILRRLQEDNYSRLLTGAYFSDIAVILERRALTSAELEKSKGVLKGRGGKVGACVLVPRVMFIPDADSPVGRGRFIQAFTVLEHPTVNASAQGTGKSAEEIAAEIFDLFQFAASSIPGQVFSAFPGGAIVPDDNFPALNGWEVRMQTFGLLRRSTRLATPLIDPEEGALPLTLTLTGPADAALYYTTNGTYPSSQNPAATLYSAPFEITAPCRVRAAAERAGWQPSSVAEAEFGPNYEFTEEFSNEFS